MTFHKAYSDVLGRDKKILLGLQNICQKIKNNYM